MPRSRVLITLNSAQQKFKYSLIRAFEALRQVMPGPGRSETKKCSSFAIDDDRENSVTTVALPEDFLRKKIGKKR